MTPKRITEKTMEEIIKDSARLGSKALRTKYRFSEATIKNVRQAYASAINGDLERLAKVYSRSAPIARWASKYLPEDQRELFDRGFYGAGVTEIKDPEEEYTPKKENDSIIPENNSEPDEYKIHDDLLKAESFLRDIRSISACLTALVYDQGDNLEPVQFLADQLDLISGQAYWAIKSVHENLRYLWIDAEFKKN